MKVVGWILVLLDSCLLLLVDVHLLLISGAEWVMRC